MKISKRNRLYNTILLFSVLSFSLSQAAEPGRIGGKVYERQSLQPLTGANVVVEGVNKGAATDEEGYFIIQNLQPGTYNLEIHYLGYTTVKKGNVIVNPKRTTTLEIAMDESYIEGETVEVTASYFEKPKESVVSTRSMNFEEIRRSPGDVADIQRAMQALPAVVSGSDQMNEIIIRGGIPGENLFLLDNIEIPNPNHFGVQGAGGGPINMLNSYMVRNVDFYAGAFSARYGDKASSVMDISQREGNRERFRAEGSLGMAGVGVLLEGPIGIKNGSYLLSARQSYLDLIISSTGLTAVPRYYNFQGKLTFELNRSNTLWVNTVYGSDKINIEGEDEAGYGRGAENVRNSNSQTIAGMTLRTFWNKHFFSHTTLSAVRSKYNIDVYDVPENTTWYTNLSDELEMTLKTDAVYRIRKNIDLNFGASVKQIRFDHDIWRDADTLFLYNPASQQPDSAIGVFRSYDTYQVNKKINSAKTAFYSQLSIDLSRYIRATGGIRYGAFDYTGYQYFEPRIGLSLSPHSRFTVNFAYGMHHQTPSYLELSANPQNKNLEDKHTRQYVVGLDYLIREDINLVVEAYKKTYHDVPVEKNLTTPDPFDDFQGALLNAGRGRASGIEVFLQKKLTHSFSTIISYAHSKSEAKDPRYGNYYNWDYDYRNVFTFIAGYKFMWQHEEWFKQMKTKWWFHAISWFPLSPSDELEISIKFRYLGGRPYTPPRYNPNIREWVVEEEQQLNPERYPEYHRFDLRIDRRFIFNTWNLVVFFDIMNIYNRDNIWDYQYNDDGTRDEILQFQTFPVGGVSLEF